MKGNRILIWVIVAVLASSLFGNTVMDYMKTHDTCGIQMGMTFEQYALIMPEGERLDFQGYSFFLNDFNYPLWARFKDDKIVQLVLIDVAKMDRSEAAFEALTAGMSIGEVMSKVGLPSISSEEEEMTLVYLLSDKLSYHLRYTLTDDILYLENVTAVKTETDEK